MIGHATTPVSLSRPQKLVLSPHVYGHGGHGYMSAADFPENMPAVWDAHWGFVPVQSGTPLLLGGA